LQVAPSLSGNTGGAVFPIVVSHCKSLPIHISNELSQTSARMR
jgi:hypothetical protein